MNGGASSNYIKSSSNVKQANYDMAECTYLDNLLGLADITNEVRASPR